MSQTPTPSGQAQDERAAFEAWARSERLDTERKPSGAYESSTTILAWSAWRHRAVAGIGRPGASATQAAAAPLADAQIKRAFEADSYESFADFVGGARFAERHHASEAAESRAALQTLLDIWHGGHLSVRPEAAGYWGAAVEAGEKLLDSTALERK